MARAGEGWRDDGGTSPEHAAARIAARRRAALDADAVPPRLTARGDEAMRHRRLLDDKRRADAAVDETSAALAALIPGDGDGDGSRPGIGLPAIGWRGMIIALIAAVAVGPAVIRVLAAVLARAAVPLLLVAAVAAALYLVGRRWAATRRAGAGAAAARRVLEDMAAESRARLGAVIGEWFRIDDTLGIGTVLRPAYSAEESDSGLDRALRSIIASADDAMAAGHDALAALDDAGTAGTADAGGTVHPAELLRRIDAADHAYLRLRFYLRALEEG